jgi:hypothetical protein
MPTIKEEMSALDKRNFNWYSSLSDEDQKKLSMWVMMRYASSTTSNITEINEHYLTIVNASVNVNFNDLRHHPELQWRLMQLAGVGTAQFHSWIPAMKQKKDTLAANNKLIAFYQDMNPYLNDTELSIMIGQLSKEDIKAELTAHGIVPKKIKEMMK